MLKLFPDLTLAFEVISIPSLNIFIEMLPLVDNSIASVLIFSFRLKE